MLPYHGTVIVGKSANQEINSIALSFLLHLPIDGCEGRFLQERLLLSCVLLQVVRSIFEVGFLLDSNVSEGFFITENQSESEASCAVSGCIRGAPGGRIALSWVSCVKLGELCVEGKVWRCSISGGA